jgi:hypothetical protein
MAQTMPTLVAPRSAPSLEAVRNMAGAFDIDAYHVMDRRDDELVAEELLHGAMSSAFVYNFDIAGTTVTGISVVGARHLAAHYRGLRHRIVASTEKIGSLFTFKSYPAENMPMSVSCAVVNELAQEPDFYSVVIEIEDIKSGNTLQVERREARFEFRRDGSAYERPNFVTIAQSKAFRNGVLSIVPQDTLIVWREAMLKLKKGETIAVGVINEKRSGVLQFAARHAIALDRRRIEALTLDQIAGLGDAARDGVPAFVNSARSLGLEIGQGEAAAALPEPAAKETPAARPRGRPPKARMASGGDDEGGGEQSPPPPPPPAMPPAEPVATGGQRLSFD